MSGHSYCQLREDNDIPWTAHFPDTTGELQQVDVDDVFDSCRDESAHYRASHTNNPKYSPLRPTGVQELKTTQDHEGVEVEHNVYDSSVDLTFNIRKRKPISKINIIICGLLCACVALILFGILYVFVILPAQKGHVIYPDGKTHSADLARIMELGENVVATDCGFMKGTREEQAYVFRGIPYAAPPTGNNRWRAPRPLHADAAAAGMCWSSVYNATRYGSKCVQPQFHDTSAVEGSEDCLFLNIWTPTLNPETLLPVMVWIHSGDFVYGSGDMPGMSPTSEIAVATNSVYVSFNYRLGAMGFLALDQLREVPTGSAGNYGFMDQQMALTWVKRNIRHFGGDENRVTVFGHGSGATSIQALLLSSGSSGLFHRAWLSSPVTVLNKTVDEACKDNRAVLTLTGCHDAQCLRALNPEEVSRASPWSLKAHWTLEQLFNIPHASQIRNALPIFDGHVVHWSSVKEGPAGPVVPVVLGSTYFDLSSLETEKNVINMTWDDYDTILVQHVSSVGREAVSQAKSLYSHELLVEYTSPTHFPPLPSAQFCRLIGDIKEVCPTKILADDFAYLFSSSAPVYMYVAEIYPSHELKLSSELKNTFIGWDMAAFFYSFQDLDFTPGQGEANFQNILRQEIMSFSKAGKPDALRWTTVDQSVGVIRRDVTMTPVTGEYFHKCDLWREYGFFGYTWHQAGAFFRSPVSH